MTCPYCHRDIFSLRDLKSLSDQELRSLRGLLNLALRKTPPKAGPGRPRKPRITP